MPARTNAPPAGEGREVLRLTGPVVLWWIWLAFVAVNVADFAIQGLSSARFGAVISAILLFATGLAYTLALRPKVVVDSLGVTVVNPYRTHHVPWQLIRSVDTGDWVRIHFASPDSASPDSGSPANADSKILYCWALYVSARAKRKSMRGKPRPVARPRGRLSGMRFGQWPSPEEVGATGDGSPWADSSRLPDEARYLASLPVAKAMAARLDTRAERERAQKRRRAEAPEPTTATASWSWPALAAAVIPALILLIVAVV